MKTWLFKVFCRLSGWRINGQWHQEIKKSVILFAPHTSFSDGFIGKFLFWGLGINHKCLMTDKYFNILTRPFLKFFGFIPVGKNSRDAIRDSVKALKDSEDLNILICPEGHLRRVEDWNKGFYVIAKMADVPVVMAYMDYRDKTGGIIGTIPKGLSWEKTKETVHANYNPEWAKYPEKFALPK